MALLGDHPLNPILPAQDGDRARAFYRDVLELDLLSGQDGIMDFGAVKSVFLRDPEGNVLALNEIVGG